MGGVHRDEQVDHDREDGNGGDDPGQRQIGNIPEASVGDPRCAALFPDDHAEGVGRADEHEDVPSDAALVAFPVNELDAGKYEEAAADDGHHRKGQAVDLVRAPQDEID